VLLLVLLCVVARRTGLLLVLCCHLLHCLVHMGALGLGLLHLFFHRIVPRPRVGCYNVSPSSLVVLESRLIFVVVAGVCVVFVVLPRVV